MACEHPLDYCLPLPRSEQLWKVSGCLKLSSRVTFLFEPCSPCSWPHQPETHSYELAQTYISQSWTSLLKWSFFQESYVPSLIILVFLPDMILHALMKLVKRLADANMGGGKGGEREVIY